MRALLCERGISPLIATLILVAATVAGGAIVYSVMQSQAGWLSGGADFEITSADIITAGGTNLATVTVKNVGSVSLTSVAATVKTDGTDVIITVGSLNPGQAKSGENTTGTWTAGSSYMVTVTGAYANGSVVKSQTVVARA